MQEGRIICGASGKEKLLFVLGTCLKSSARGAIVDERWQLLLLKLADRLSARFLMKSRNE